MMGLAEALAKEQHRHNGPRCSVCVLLEKLDKADRAVLEAAMADKAVASSAIARALVSEGHEMRAETIRRHRTRECAGKS